MHIVLTTIPPRAAESLACSLVEERVAACVNVLPGVTSIYRWDGALQRELEALLIIKTSSDSLPRLMRRLRALHPYDVPEIVALDASHVDPAYARWIAAETDDARSR